MPWVFSLQILVCVKCAYGNGFPQPPTPPPRPSLEQQRHYTAVQGSKGGRFLLRGAKKIHLFQILFANSAAFIFFCSAQRNKISLKAWIRPLLCDVTPFSCCNSAMIRIINDPGRNWRSCVPVGPSASCHLISHHCPPKKWKKAPSEFLF